MRIDIEVPEGLNPDLAALGWLVGRWEGTGNGTDHEGNDFSFEQRIEFSHNGEDYLYYASQTFVLDDEGNPSSSLGMESGFWRPKADASVEVVVSSSHGWTEVLVGDIKVIQISLRSDAVVRSASAAVSHTAGQRLYGKVEGDLMYAIDRATEDHELRPWMWARLRKM